MNIRGRVRSWSALVALGNAFAVLSCGVVLSFDPYNTDPPHVDASIADSPEPRYAIRGVVSGLGNAKLSLAAAGQRLAVQDGPFEFPRVFPQGTPVAVTIAELGTGRSCAISGGNTTVADRDVTGVTVACAVTYPELAALSIVSCIGDPAVSPCMAFPTLVPSFDPASRSYSARVPIVMTRVEISAQPRFAEVVVEIAGVAAASHLASVPLQPGKNAVPIVVSAPDGTSAKYEVVVDAVAGMYLKASNARSGARFGSAVALDADTLVVASPGESSGATGIGGFQGDTSAPDAGAVYVFTRTTDATGARWSQTAYLKAANARAGSRFGSSVVLVGDTLVVGADGDPSGAGGVDANALDATAPGAGAAYVFERANGAWTQSHYLKASNARSNARFGAAVAMFEGTLVVGAPGESGGASGVDPDQNDTSQPNAGAAYVFARSGSTWIQQSFVKATDPLAGRRFGAGVAVRGDWLAIGAPADVGGAGPATVYLLGRVGGSWSHTTQPSSTGADAGYGAAIGFGPSFLAVGSPGDEAVAYFEQLSDAGSVVGGTFMSGQPLSGHEFGASIALPAGNDEIAIGAPNDNGGTVFLRSRSSVGPSRRANMPKVGARFGAAVAASGTTLAVGAPGDSSKASGVSADEADESAPGAGAVYVY